jgi:AraC-like DNA-binding protein
MRDLERKRPATAQKQPRRKPGAATVHSVARRLRLRDEFFRNQINPRQLLAPFDHIPGIRYFVKDAKSRMMALSSKRVAQLCLTSEEEVIGLTDRDFLPSEIADQFLADDQWVIHHGQPLRNRVEMGLDENGFRDWTITDKYPLVNAPGKVVGLIGTIQFFEARRKMLGYFGPVGKAADFIRDRLSEGLMLSEIARHAGLSERQLQRLFRRALGMTIQQFIIRSRIQAAMHELTRSQRSIAEIALMFGFSDQSAFTNQFRSVAGLPPRVYRERYLAKLTMSRK